MSANLSPFAQLAKLAKSADVPIENNNTLAIVAKKRRFDQCRAQRSQTSRISRNTDDVSIKLSQAVDSAESRLKSANKACAVASGDAARIAARIARNAAAALNTARSAQRTHSMQKHGK